MENFDIKDVGAKIAAEYSGELRSHLPRVKFMLDDSPAVSEALSGGRVFSILRPYNEFAVGLPLDGYFFPDATLNLERLCQDVVAALRERLIATVNEIDPDQREAVYRIGEGPLWVVHKAYPPVFTVGRALVECARDGNCEVRVQAAWNTEEHQTDFEARVHWAIVRSAKAGQKH